MSVTRNAIPIRHGMLGEFESVFERVVVSVGQRPRLTTTERSVQLGAEALMPTDNAVAWGELMLAAALALDCMPSELIAVFEERSVEDRPRCRLQCDRKRRQLLGIDRSQPLE